GYQREDDADEDEELAGGQDLILRDQPGKAVHPLARPDDQHRCDGPPARYPRGLRQGDWSEDVDEEIAYRDHQRPAGPAFRGLLESKELVQPRRHGEEAGDKGQGPVRLDQVEHRSREPDQRESPDAAGDCWFVALVDFLKGEAEKKREDEQQGQPFGEFDRRHRFLYTPSGSGGIRRFAAERL